MATEHQQRLEALVSRRDALQQKKQRVEGRLEAARDAQATVEQECRDRGLDPDKLDQAIDKVEGRLSQALQELEQGIDGAEQALAPFLREDS